MRVIIGCLVTFMALLGGVAHASETFDTEKVKTGILPSGGFYSLYAVDCDDQFTAANASLNRKRRWCTSFNGELSCFSRRQEASARACMSGEVAASDDDIKGFDKYQ
jgi:hypothetical protein